MSRFLKELDKTGKQNVMKKMTAAHTRQCNFPPKCTDSQYSQAYSWHIMRYIVATTHAMSWASLTVAEKLNRYSDFWLTMLFSCGRTREITGIKNSHASFIARRRTNCFIWIVLSTDLSNFCHTMTVAYAFTHAGPEGCSSAQNTARSEGRVSKWLDAKVI